MSDLVKRFRHWLHKYGFCLWEYEGIEFCDNSGCIYEYRCKICGAKDYTMYRG